MQQGRHALYREYHSRQHYYGEHQQYYGKDHCGSLVFHEGGDEQPEREGEGYVNERCRSKPEYASRHRYVEHEVCECQYGYVVEARYCEVRHHFRENYINRFYGRYQKRFSPITPGTKLYALFIWGLYNIRILAAEVSGISAPRLLEASSDCSICVR